MPRRLPILTPFLDRFFIDFYLQLRSPEPSKSLFFLRKNKLFQKIAFRSWHRFLFDFGANMLPFCFQKSTNILPKIDPKMHRFFDRFLHRFFFDFGGQLGAMLATFSLKTRRRGTSRGWFMLGLSSFSVFGSPGPLLAPSGLELGGFGPPFWRFLVPNFFTISKFLALIFLQP